MVLPGSARQFQGEGSALAGPSLRTFNEPPISFAASAPLCRPKPWPSLRVVKPWLKMRVRFSGTIPTPLSITDILIRPSPLPRAPSAVCPPAPIPGRLVWRCPPGSSGSAGVCACQRSSAAHFQIRGPLPRVAVQSTLIHAQAVLHQIDHVDYFLHPADPRIVLLHGHNFIDVLDVLTQRIQFANGRLLFGQEVSESLAR